MTSYFRSCFLIGSNSASKRNNNAPKRDELNSLLELFPFHDNLTADSQGESHRANNEVSSLLIKKVISFVGRRGAGKSVLFHALAQDEWITHPARRTMLKPAMQFMIIHLARQLVAKMIVSGELQTETESPIFRGIIQDLMRPLNVISVDPQTVVLLHELGLFGRLIKPDSTMDEGFLNAYEILVKQFPFALFCDPDNIPTNEQLQLCRPSTVAVCESRCTDEVKLVDTPGMIDGANAGLHAYAMEPNKETAVVHVVGLHAIEGRLPAEVRAFVDTYTEISESWCTVTRMGLLFSQADRCQISMDEIRAIVASFLSALLEARPSPLTIPIHIAVTSGFDVESARVALKGFTRDQVFVAGGSAEDNFLSCGVAPHFDEEFSLTFNVETVWLRSVFGGLGEPTLVRELCWNPSLYRLLSLADRKIATTLLMCGNHPGSPLALVPGSTLVHILTFSLSIANC